MPINAFAFLFPITYLKNDNEILFNTYFWPHEVVLLFVIKGPNQPIDLTFEFGVDLEQDPGLSVPNKVPAQTSFDLQHVSEFVLVRGGKDVHQFCG
jgi:hypothetical protein